MIICSPARQELFTLIKYFIFLRKKEKFQLHCLLIYFFYTTLEDTVNQPVKGSQEEDDGGGDPLLRMMKALVHQVMTNSV